MLARLPTLELRELKIALHLLAKLLGYGLGLCSLMRLLAAHEVEGGLFRPRGHCCIPLPMVLRPLLRRRVLLKEQLRGLCVLLLHISKFLRLARRFGGGSGGGGHGGFPRHLLDASPLDAFLRRLRSLLLEE